MPAVKKLVNVFFSLVLVMGLLPVTAFASPSQGAEEGASGKAVVVGQDNTIESTSGSEAPSSGAATEDGTTSTQSSGANSGKSDSNSDQKNLKMLKTLPQAKRTLTLRIVGVIRMVN